MVCGARLIWMAVGLALLATLAVSAQRSVSPQALRSQMVEQQIRARGVRDPRVLEAMLEEAGAVRYEEGAVVLAFPPGAEAVRRMFEREDTLSFVRSAARELWGEEVPVRVETAAAPQEAPAAPKARSRGNPAVLRARSAGSEPSEERGEH